jgi:hypothetical protein
MLQGKSFVFMIFLSASRCHAALNALCFDLSLSCTALHIIERDGQVGKARFRVNTEEGNPWVPVQVPS